MLFLCVCFLHVCPFNHWDQLNDIHEHWKEYWLLKCTSLPFEFPTNMTDARTREVEDTLVTVNLES
jgi:hypothetical protein